MHVSRPTAVCGPGYYVDPADSVCKECAVASYNDGYAAAACTPCGTLYTTAAAGSKTKDDCCEWGRLALFVSLGPAEPGPLDQGSRFSNQLRWFSHLHSNFLRTARMPYCLENLWHFVVS